MRARDNPFSVERIERLEYRLQPGASWESLLNRLAGMQYRAAVVGDHGSGKTTFLRHLRDRLAEAGHRVHPLFLNQDSGTGAHRQAIESAAQADQASIVLLDGADHLSRFSWWRMNRIARRCRGFIITSHQVGLLPTLLECRPSVGLLRELIVELAGSDGQAGSLYERHQANLREALREMYDLYALNPEP